jgi:hypothetical protein
MTACKQCDFPDHLCGCDTQPAQPEQERNVWRWHDLSLHDIKSAIEAKLKEKNNV